MKNLLVIKTISLIMVALFAFGGITVAEEPKPVTVEFSTVETDDGIVELNLAVKDATFMGIQAAVRYNTESLAPVDEAGVETVDFKKFATKSEQAEFFNPVGLELDVEKGLFGFTLYIMPGAEGEGVNALGEYTADDKGINLYTFRFKKIADKDYNFEIALKDDVKPYVSVLSEGLIIMNYADGSLKADVSFIYEDKEPEHVTILPTISKPIMNDETRKKDVICLQIGKNLAVAYGEKKEIDSENKLVVPYISGDRTLVPLRFVAETLGADVLWEDGWDGCVIKKGEKEIKITFGSAEFVVNGKTVTYDAPIEVVEERTMVPIRFISEEFDCDVYWNALNKAVVVSPIDNPWVETRQAEITALNEMLVTILSII
ncbi:MAG: copper amine oxidase N-terminal domain-containing protein [Clostridia bacterium]|nr:copper amine oxidase N-terminal domain-containing protein [Clostridia bacterium]